MVRSLKAARFRSIENIGKVRVIGIIWIAICQILGKRALGLMVILIASRILGFHTVGTVKFEFCAAIAVIG